MGTILTVKGGQSINRGYREIKERNECLIWNGVAKDLQLCRFHWTLGRQCARLVIRTFRHGGERAYLQLNPRHIELWC